MEYDAQTTNTDIEEHPFEGGETDESEGER